MKKKIFIGVALVSLFSILGINSISVKADSSSLTTDGTISFDKNDGSEVIPVNPTDPTKPVDPTNPTEPDNKENPDKGQLALVVAPSKFNFGAHKVNPAGGTYKAIPQNKAKDSLYYLQVSDLRDAGINGWSVSVKQDSPLIEGSTLTIPAGTAKNSIDTNATGLTSKAVALTDNNEATVFSADKSLEAGKGQSVSSWKVDDVSFTTVANTEVEGAYTNTLTWTLTASAVN